MSIEEWKQVENFPNYYISNMGNIRSKRGVLTPGLDTDGYRQINLYNKDGKGFRGTGRYTMKIYRLVILAFGEPSESNKTQIDHINRNKIDDRIVNLRWVTCRENNINKGSVEDMIGINWIKKNKMYMVRAYGGVNKKQIYLGCRGNIEDAKKLLNDYLRDNPI
jgi:hypothetical protein